MVANFYDYSARFLSESGYFDSLTPFSKGYSGDFEGGGSIPSAAAAALVLGNEKGELVKAAAAKVGKRGVCEAKNLAALKSHSEAERRRRERINAHLDTLRGLVPCTDKMDKATLLAEVIKEVKQLKIKATEASQGLLIPMDDDEIQVEPYNNRSGVISMYKASLCCEYRSEILSDIRQALEVLQLKLVNTEISTLGNRLKIQLILLTSGTNKNAEAQNFLVNCIRKALTSVIEKCSLTLAYSPRTTLPNKRRRLGLFDSPGSSS